MPAVVLRDATADDVAALAAVHVRSWREHYRGLYRDSFLDGEASAERLRVWRGRLSASDPARLTIVAEMDSAVVGFAHAMLDADPERGAVLQNLHVSTTAQRKGIASSLVTKVACCLMERRPRSGLHVWVREDNPPARAFYAALGGKVVDRDIRGPFADGGRAAVVCLAWPNPASLMISH
ncbi:MAG: GNAT family N-acetyltransferase [Acidimicrobiia bacterium]|nr:GNAT family N-acetyltransferase [Acidimicrobiia bacterium]